MSICNKIRKHEDKRSKTINAALSESCNIAAKCYKVDIDGPFTLEEICKTKTIKV
jgi:hypothetical protein